MPTINRESGYAFQKIMNRRMSMFEAKGGKKTYYKNF
jgi:hypothetical protein